MSELRAAISWQHIAIPTSRGLYLRDFEWGFPGGMVIGGTGSFAGLPRDCYSEEHVTAEQALLAAVASAHLVSFLQVAAAKGIVVEGYNDEATARLAKRSDGSKWISHIFLQPQAVYGVTGANSVTPAVEARLHNLACERSVIAGSLRAKVTVRSRTFDYTFKHELVRQLLVLHE
jgi:organic hydroperoxide reductase OsmC/OhrA